jgi:hypothetical protein
MAHHSTNLHRRGPAPAQDPPRVTGQHERDLNHPGPGWNERVRRQPRCDSEPAVDVALYQLSRPTAAPSETVERTR